MPYTVKTKDGITLPNIPDELAPDSPEVRAMVAKARGGGSGAPASTQMASHAPSAATTQESGQQEKPYDPTVLEHLAFSTPVQAITDIPISLAQLVLKAPGVPDSVRERFQNYVNERERLYKQNPENQNLLGDINRGIISTAGQTALGIGAAKQFAGPGAVPVTTTQGVARVLASQPETQLAGAAGSAAATEIARDAGAGPLGQTLAGLGGGMASAHVATPRTVLPSVGQVPGMAEAEQAGIKTMTSDVIPPRTFAGKWLRSMGEKIPIAGTGGPRQGQQLQRIEAIKDLMTEYGAHEMASVSDEVAKDLLSKHSADVTKYVNLKKGVIGKLAQKGSVPVNNTVKAIDDQIVKLKSLNTKEVEPVVARLEDWKGAIQGQSLDNVEMLRAQIGESFKAPEMAASRSIAEKSLSGIYGPLKEDMGNFIKTNGDRTDYTKWRVANGRLSESMQDLNKSVLKNVLDKGKETPEVVQKMLFSSKPSDVKALMKGLTADGKAKARVAILAKALDGAGGVENLSPDKFITSVRKLGVPIGVAFDGQEAQRLNGLVRALKLTEHASKAALVTPTGVQAVPIVGAAVLTDLLGGAGTAMATMATTGGLARVYESGPVRDLLLKLPRIAAGTPEEAALFKRFTAAVQAQNATQQENQQ
jgi:hypothetical protein